MNTCDPNSNAHTTGADDSLWVTRSIFNGMDAYIYVSDIETDEILFINDKMRELFDPEGGLVGKVCWQVLQSGYTGRCPDCPVTRLLARPDQSVVWEELNTVNHKYYRNADRLIRWIDGRLVHMQHAIDITEVKLAQAAINKRMSQQELMANISKRFIAEDDTPALMQDALRDAGEFTGCDRILLAMHNADARALNIEHEWRDPALRCDHAYGGTIPFEPGTLVYDALIAHGEPHIAIDYNDAVGQIACAQVRAQLVVPLIFEREPVGVLEFDRCQASYHWTESDVHLANLLASVFAGVIYRQRVSQKLIDARDAAERANHAKTDFLARMSHEIRTPMNAIIGMTNIAKGTDSIARKDYCLSKIDSASHHLLGVINDILDMTEIESGNFQLHKSEFDFEAMLKNVVSTIAFRVDEKNHNLLVDISEHVPKRVISDEQRLSQVITNLLSNAVKFTPDGGEIKLSTEVEDDAGGDVALRITVSDNGIGISDEQRKRLFTSFEQGDGGTARRFGGTGLGLAISKQIVEMLGGAIEIESKLGAGSQFSFRFIVKRGGDTAELRPERSLSKRRLRILAVDDSSETRDYFVQVMRSLDLECDVAADGEEALKMISLAASDPYNLFFVDWLMPGMDGIELTRRIKDAVPCESVVIMISAARWSDIEREATQAGASHFLPKPLFPSAIVNCINECLGVAQPELETAGESAPPLPDFTGRTILLVEDVEINREIVAALLEGTHIAIEYAHDGAEAVERVREHGARYQLVFMDIHMPVMDGYEATRRIRALGGGDARKLPIIAMTANAFKEDVERCLKCGMDDHIAKPLNARLLIQKLQQHLR